MPKTVIHRCFVRKNVWAKKLRFFNLKRFFGFYAKTFANSVFWSVPIERAGKIFKNEKSKFCKDFVNFLSKLC